MKKFSLAIIVCLICAFLLTACGSNQGEVPNTGSSQSNKTENEVSYSEMLPSNDIFKNGEFTIIDSDGGDMYAFSVIGFTDEEFTEYVSQCKELGFDDITYDLDSQFGAYSTDGEYWVQLSKESDGSLSIICNKSKNK